MWKVWYRRPVRMGGRTAALEIARARAPESPRQPNDVDEACAGNGQRRCKIKYIVEAQRAKKGRLLAAGPCPRT